MKTGDMNVFISNCKCVECNKIRAIRENTNAIRENSIATRDIWKSIDSLTEIIENKR